MHKLVLRPQPGLHTCVQYSGVPRDIACMLCAGSLRCSSMCACYVLQLPLRFCYSLVFWLPLIPETCFSDGHQTATLTGRQIFAGAWTHQQLFCQPQGLGSILPWELGITFWGWKSLSKTASVFSSVTKGSSSCSQHILSCLCSSEVARDDFLLFLP